jgi:outer membrane protein OmpA-like peptidoglycan-associated protein
MKRTSGSADVAIGLVDGSFAPARPHSARSSCVRSSPDDDDRKKGVIEMKRVWLMVVMMTVLVLAVAPARAGIGDKLKKKAEDKAKKEADKALNTADDEARQEADQPDSSGEASAEAAPKGGGDVAGVSTKFDYVPGDKVLFFDDFTQDELGEFPTRWKLKIGTFEVAEMSGQRWLRCTAVDGTIAMKTPAMPALPEYWTLEFDFYCTETVGNVLTVSGLKGDGEIWNTVYTGPKATFRTGDIMSDTPIEDGAAWGKPHHVMLMARGPALKVYVDRQRVASVPEVNGAPDSLHIRLWADTGPMITNVRFAEGNKPVADPFANGTLVTYGIYFDSGSDLVKPESAPVLRQIAAYMERNAAVKVQIVGHTDSQGTAEGNLDLSKRRAASVAEVLSAQFKIGADRFQIDGLGETKPISNNDTAEGRAANRRVEFTKT